MEIQIVISSIHKWDRKVPFFANMLLSYKVEMLRLQFSISLTLNKSPVLEKALSCFILHSILFIWIKCVQTKVSFSTYQQIHNNNSDHTQKHNKREKCDALIMDGWRKIITIPMKNVSIVHFTNHHDKCLGKCISWWGKGILEHKQKMFWRRIENIVLKKWNAIQNSELNR